MRELENYQHVSPEANVSRFSFICYSSETGMLYFNTTQFIDFRKVLRLDTRGTNLSRLRRSLIHFAYEKSRFARRNIFSWDYREVDLWQVYTIQCLLIFCSTYHRQPSVCFTEASRFTEKLADNEVGIKMSEAIKRYKIIIKGT